MGIRGRKRGILPFGFLWGSQVGLLGRGPAVPEGGAR